MNDVTVDFSLGWNPDEDEHRRAAILEWMGNVLNNPAEAEEWFQWLKFGPAKVSGSPILRPVK